MQCTARLRLLKYNNDHRTVNICSGHFTCKKSNINIIFRDFFQHRSVLNIHFTSRTSFPFGDQMKKKLDRKSPWQALRVLRYFGNSYEVTGRILDLSRGCWTTWFSFTAAVQILHRLVKSLFSESTCYFSRLTRQSPGDVMILRVSLSLWKCLSFVYPANDYCGNIGKER